MEKTDALTSASTAGPGSLEPTVAAPITISADTITTPSNPASGRKSTSLGSAPEKQVAITAATTAVAATTRETRAPSAAAIVAYSNSARTATTEVSTSVPIGGSNHTVPTTTGMRTSAE